MLVLTRKQSEKIRIGNDITITVLRSKGKAIRLGIEAPAHMRVLRGELVFELPPEGLEQETAGADNVKEPVPRQTAKASGHRQPPIPHWPASPEGRTDTPGTPATPKATTSGPPNSLVHSMGTEGASREQKVRPGNRRCV